MCFSWRRFGNNDFITFSIHFYNHIYTTPLQPLLKKSKLRLPVAAVEVYIGGSYVDHTTPLPHAPVLRWLVFVHFQWGSAEVTESSLAGQTSTLRLPVAAAKVYIWQFLR